MFSFLCVLFPLSLPPHMYPLPLPPLAPPLTSARMCSLPLPPRIMSARVCPLPLRPLLRHRHLVCAPFNSHLRFTDEISFIAGNELLGMSFLLFFVLTTFLYFFCRREPQQTHLHVGARG